jgi:2-dehydro-3-deoxyglucarate aldolase/4-hydroxy-2-oxoheptanedioate aldolase
LRWARGAAARHRGTRGRRPPAGIVGIVQIESPGALREVDAIAAIDGVDVLFVGPADLSHSLCIPGQFSNPTYLAALDAVVAACRRHGKAAGILLYDSPSFGPHLARGFRFLGVGSEGLFIAEGAKAALGAARAAAAG